MWIWVPKRCRFSSWKQDPYYVLKNCWSRLLLFSLVFILSHIVRFVLNLINQYHSYFTQIHLYVKGILNLRARTQANTWNDTPIEMLTKAQLLPSWTKSKRKVKSYTWLFLVVMSLFACTCHPSMSDFVTNFGYSRPPYLGDVIFEWSLTTLCLFSKQRITNW